VRSLSPEARLSATAGFNSRQRYSTAFGLSLRSQRAGIPPNLPYRSTAWSNQPVTRS